MIVYCECGLGNWVLILEEDYKNGHCLRGDCFRDIPASLVCRPHSSGSMIAAPDTAVVCCTIATLYY